MPQQHQHDYRFDNQFAQRFSTIVNHQQPEPLQAPQLVIANRRLLEQLQLPIADERLAAVFGGAETLTGMTPIAQKYAGHQFGQYNPYLGDGRGLLLGEWVTTDQRFDIHLKGAGPTPYSRGGDGRAVLRSSIREFLASEAMHHLGIATTRALAVVAGATPVQRETVEPGAILTRVARTHVRFGHFEHCYHRGLSDALEGLIQYVIETQWPDLQAQPRQQFFERVVSTTAEMVAGWQAYGFNHGVMNTDNMSIVGETFDYGPYQFMDNYHPQLICNHSDHSGRYAFDQQPSIALWNLNCLALALSPCIHSDDLVAALEGFAEQMQQAYWRKMAQRFGLTDINSADKKLMGEWLGLLAQQSLDYALSMRALAEAPTQGLDDLLATDASGALAHWWQQYQERWQADALSADAQSALMLATNPRYLLRNHLAQNAIVAAEQGDLSVLNTLYAALQKPFDYQSEWDHLAQPAPAWAKDLQISCSS